MNHRRSCVAEKEEEVEDDEVEEEKKDREKRKNVDAEGPSGNKVGAWKGALAYCELPSQYRFHPILRNFPSARSRLVLQQLNEMKPGIDTRERRRRWRSRGGRGGIVG